MYRIAKTNAFNSTTDGYRNHKNSCVDMKKICRKLCNLG